MVNLTEWFQPKRQHSIRHGHSALSGRTFRSLTPSSYSQTLSYTTPITDTTQTDQREYTNQGPYSAGHGMQMVMRKTVPTRGRGQIDTSKRPQSAMEGSQESGVLQIHPQAPLSLPNWPPTTNSANTEEFSLKRNPTSPPAIAAKPPEYQTQVNTQDTSQRPSHHPSSSPQDFGHQQMDEELLESEMIVVNSEVDELKMEKSELLRERQSLRQKWKLADENHQNLYAQYQNLIIENSRLQALINLREERKKEIIQSERSKLQKQDEGLKRRQHATEQKLIAATSDIRRYKDDIEKRDRKIMLLETRNGQLDKDVVNQQEDIQRRKSELKKMDNELEAERIEKKQLLDRNKVLTNMIRDQAQCIEDLEKELSEAKDFRDHQAQSIRKIQEKAFQPRDEAQWMQDTNEEVSDQLNGIGKQLQKWCKIYCSKTPLRLETMLPEDKASIQDLLTHVGNGTDGTLYSRFDDSDVNSRLAELLLMSSLSHTLYNTMFCNPFFFENDDLGTPSASNCTQDGPLSTVWRQILSSDRKAANHWVAQTLQLLDPNSKATQSVQNLSNSLSNLRRAAAERFSVQFITQCPQALLDANSRKSAEDKMAQLTEIALKVADVSYRLWTQRRELSCLWMHELEAESALQFDSRSQLLEHHPLHNVQLSQDENALDGKAVAIVTQPLVVAYGDSKGEKYSERTVLRKAVVWMG